MPIANEHDFEDAAEIAQSAADHARYLQTREHLGANSEFTDMLAAVAREVPEVKPQFAEAILDLLADNGWLASSQRKRSAVQLPQWMAKFHKILRYIKDHPNNNAIYAVLHIWDEPTLDLINRNLTQTEFADEMYPSPQQPNPAKAAVNNAVVDAQRFFKVKPRRDQRKEEARTNMSQSLINRLEDRSNK